MDLPQLRLVSLEELERAFPRLLSVKQERTRIEYYFTCTPLIAQYVVTQSPGLEMVTYLDADIFFFADPEPIFDEMKGASVGIVEHRHNASLMAELEPFGIYNVGLVTFRCDDEGQACLELWCEQCLDWCYDRLESDRYADQKYLEQWPKLFSRVRVLQHKGANVAPWNFMNYKFRQCGERVFVDEQPLIFFHFHGFKRKTAWLYDTHSARYAAKPSRTMRKAVVEPYIRALNAQQGYALPLSDGIRQQPQGPWAQHLKALIRRRIGILSRIIKGQQVIVIGNRILY
jgi:hypothetical protein